MLRTTRNRSRGAWRRGKRGKGGLLLDRGHDINHLLHTRTICHESVHTFVGMSLVRTPVRQPVHYCLFTLFVLFCLICFQEEVDVKNIRDIEEVKERISEALDDAWELPEAERKKV